MEVMPVKHLLLQEYASVNGLEPLEPNKQNVDSAIRFLFKQLLRDMRPPWLGLTFPQALPGTNVLGRLTRPLFLSWDLAEGNKVFGETVAALLAKMVADVGLELKGYLAKPCYVCTSTSRPDRHMCMAVASMSDLIEHADGRLHYRCTNCKQHDAGESASGNSPLRVLQLYALAGETREQVLTPMHSKPVRLVVSAPPAIWAWGLRGPLPPVRTFLGTDIPMPVNDVRGRHWRYNKTQSDTMRYSASPYCGEASD